MSQDKEVKKAMDNYYSTRENGNPAVVMDYTQKQPVIMPKYENTAYDKKITDQLNDADLQVGFDTVKLPSKGIFYRSKSEEVVIEYLTSKDEDILTTPSLIENNTLFDVLLKAKIKTKGIEVDELLSGDKNALLMFLRASSYGKNYDVEVIDPFNGKLFKTAVDLTKFTYKEVNELPDENLLFSVDLPNRKKHVKFRLLSDSEMKKIVKQAQNKQEAVGTPFLEILSMRLKASIVDIDSKTDRNYISKFVDAMPAGDSLALRRRIDEVTPTVDMAYEFTSPAGYTFKTDVSIGYDFFFPKL
jgi:hypothetical protein